MENTSEYVPPGDIGPVGPSSLTLRSRPVSSTGEVSEQAEDNHPPGDGSTGGLATAPTPVDDASASNTSTDNLERRPTIDPEKLKVRYGPFRVSPWSVRRRGVARVRPMPRNVTTGDARLQPLSPRRLRFPLTTRRGPGPRRAVAARALAPPGPARQLIRGQVAQIRYSFPTAAGIRRMWRGRFMQLSRCRRPTLPHDPPLVIDLSRCDEEETRREDLSLTVGLVLRSMSNTNSVASPPFKGMLPTAITSNRPIFTPKQLCEMTSFMNALVGAKGMHPRLRDDFHRLREMCPLGEDDYPYAMRLAVAHYKLQSPVHSSAKDLQKESLRLLQYLGLTTTTGMIVARAHFLDDDVEGLTLLSKYESRPSTPNQPPPKRESGSSQKKQAERRRQALAAAARAREAEEGEAVITIPDTPDEPPPDDEKEREDSSEFRPQPYVDGGIGGPPLPDDQWKVVVPRALVESYVACERPYAHLPSENTKLFTCKRASDLQHPDGLWSERIPRIRGPDQQKFQVRLCK